MPPLVRASALWFLVWVGCARGVVPCAGSSSCPPSKECLANRCVVSGGKPVSAGARRVVATPSGMALADEDDRARLGASITLGTAGHRRALYLLFDPVWSGRPIEAAFLLLEIREKSLAGPDLELEVWRVRRPWTAKRFLWSEQPGMAPPMTRGLSRARPALPVRVDVTELLRFAQAHPDQHHGLVLRAGETSPQGVVLATGLDGGAPPRLEVYLL